MRSCEASASSTAAIAILSAPVLRSAMEAPRCLADRAVRTLVESGFAEGVLTVRSLIWRCHRWLTRYHRGDVVYRKAVVTEMLAYERGILLPEFRADRSFVDFLSVSDHLHAVEIKSDLDNASRLARQLVDYRKIAPLVSVIGAGYIVDRLASDSRFSSVGLHQLDEGGRLQALRMASFDPMFLDSEAMMRSLRRVEYLCVLAELGVELPALPNTRLFSAAMKRAIAVDPALYYVAFSSQLRKRKPRAGRTAIAKLPAPVRPAIWQLDPTSTQIFRLHQWLDQEVSYVYA